MSLGICLQNYIPLRAEPSERSEMISQVLFGEIVEIIEINKETGFSRVIILFDNYKGWLDSKTLVPLDEKTHHQMVALEEYVLPEINNIVTLNNNNQLNIGAGSTLWKNNNNSIVYPENVLSLDSEILEKNINKREVIIESALKWINIPYIWGGRSSCGADCSGFVQNIFKQVGIKLPRDAHKQAEIGKSIDFHINGRPGDLAFFDNKEGEIKHVGILLDSSLIIHSSGIIKVEKIDQQGIFSKKEVNYTHNLRLMKDVIGD